MQESVQGPGGGAGGGVAEMGGSACCVVCELFVLAVCG